MHINLKRAAALGVAVTALGAGARGASAVTSVGPGVVTGHWYQRHGGELNVVKSGNTKYKVTVVSAVRLRGCQLKTIYSLTRYAPDLFGGTVLGDPLTKPCDAKKSSGGIWTLFRNRKGAQRLKLCVYPASGPRHKACTTFRRTH